MVEGREREEIVSKQKTQPQADENGLYSTCGCGPKVIVNELCAIFAKYFAGPAANPNMCLATADEAT